MTQVSDITLKAECHCGLVSYSYTLPASAFPLKSALCHCGSCRRVTGQLFATFAVIPSPHRPDVSHLKEYASSSFIRRYFCPRCGASVLNTESEEWEFPSGILEKTEGLLNRVQLFINDTKDGGAALWLAAGLPVMHSQDRQSRLTTVQEVIEMERMSQNASGNMEERLPASCHCGDVFFTISKGKEKYPAGLDACTSCRKVTGFEITAWVTVPKNSISMRDGSPFNFASPTLTKYNTSPNVVRYFCSRCGATIFYLKDGNDTVDIGVGLLEAQSGARAEEFLRWEKYDNCVAYQEDAIDSMLVQALITGMQECRL
jgi:hypothetical protein